MKRTHAKPGRLAVAAAAFGLLVTGLAAPGAQAASRSSGVQQDGRPPLSAGPNFTNLPAPLSMAECQSSLGIKCYTPAQFHTAYHLDSLYRRQIDGRGRTIVIPIPFGSPTIRHDLEVFSRQFHLPDPQLRIIRFGAIPPYDPTDLTRIEWAAGTTLVAEQAHAIAPRARIVIAETAVSEDEGVSGFPELFQAEQALIDAGIGDVFAHIEGTLEASFPGADVGDYSSLYALRGTLGSAAAHGVTMLASAGNGGVRSGWPSLDPLVTSVGASQLYLNAAGRQLRPPTTWNDGFGGAGGGGLSAAFGRPGYQFGVRDVVGDHRGAPDITMSGSVDGGGWIYASFGGVGGIGWDIFDGTGQAMAQFAGIVALADQMAGHRLGWVNPALYRLGELSRRPGHHRTGIVDITEGNTSHDGLIGHQATPGYDLATGWGTIDAARFVPALVHAARQESRH
jgi:subtilase family serine protease